MIFYRNGYHHLYLGLFVWEEIHKSRQKIVILRHRRLMNVWWLSQQFRLGFYFEVDKLMEKLNFRVVYAFHSTLSFSIIFQHGFFPRALFEVRPFHQRYLEVHILAFNRRLSYSIRKDGCGYCQLSVGNAHSTSLHINDRYMSIACKPMWIRNCIFLTYDSGSCYTHVSWFSIHFCFYFVFLGSIWINAYINRRDRYRKKQDYRILPEKFNELLSKIEKKIRKRGLDLRNDFPTANKLEVIFQLLTIHVIERTVLCKQQTDKVQCSQRGIPNEMPAFIDFQMTRFRIPFFPSVYLHMQEVCFQYGITHKYIYESIK